MSAVVIFINKEASRIDNLFLNQNWDLKELFPSVYRIIVNEKSINWLVKVYKNKKEASYESSVLHRLKDVNGVPKVLTATLSDSKKELNYIIMSEMPGIDLYQYRKKHGVFTEKELRPIVKQLLEILKKIHKKGVIHRDIKPENILYDKKTDKVSLIDFEKKETETFCSPEQVKGQSISTQSDMWSLGVTCYNLVRNKELFSNNKEILRKKIIFPKSWSNDFKDFLECLLQNEKIYRYNAVEALNHSWISE